MAATNDMMNGQMDLSDKNNKSLRKKVIDISDRVEKLEKDIDSISSHNETVEEKEKFIKDIVVKENENFINKYEELSKNIENTEINKKVNDYLEEQKNIVNKIDKVNSSYEKLENHINEYENTLYNKHEEFIKNTNELINKNNLNNKILIDEINRKQDDFIKSSNDALDKNNSKYEDLNKKYEELSNNAEDLLKENIQNTMSLVKIQKI